MGSTAWNQKWDDSFERLKRKLTTPILIAPKCNKEFRFHLDASNFATDATLTQLDEKGRERVIA